MKSQINTYTCNALKNQSMERGTFEAAYFHCIKYAHWYMRHNGCDITSMDSTHTHISKSMHKERLPFLSRQCANRFDLSASLSVSKWASMHACLIAHICQVNVATRLRKFNKLATAIWVKKKLVSFENEDLIDHFGGTNNYTIPQYATLLTGF